MVRLPFLCPLDSPFPDDASCCLQTKFSTMSTISSRFRTSKGLPIKPYINPAKLPPQIMTTACTVRANHSRSVKTLFRERYWRTSRATCRPASNTEKNKAKPDKMSVRSYGVTRRATKRISTQSQGKHRPASSSKALDMSSERKGTFRWVVDR